MGSIRTTRSQHRVLVVDDNVDTYELYSEILTSAGYAVLGADNGEDAIRKAIELQPDVILMDYQLPGIDGPTTTKRLKQDARTRAIPVVMLTGYVGRAHVDRARASGCDEFLVKPCPIDRLLAEVAAQVRRRCCGERTLLLLVEDDEGISQALATLLDDEGYGVVIVSNGREALRYLDEAERLPGLILLDLMMPVMDGWSFRQAQLDDDRLAGIPVVVLSAVSEARRRERELCAAAYLAKPIQVPRLLDVIHHHV